MIDTGHLATESATAAVVTARFLTPVVRSTQALAVNVKQAHWNLRGVNFIAIHELLDTVAANARDSADAAAERIVALGLPVDARLATVADSVAPTTVGAGFTPWEDAVRSVVQDLDAAIGDADRAIAGLNEADLVSQDVAIAVKASLDKDRWLLVAHLAG